MSFIERPRTACALSGALATMSALPEVAPIIHSSIGCGGALAGASSFGSGYFGSGYCSGFSAPSSAITESDIVFGGNDRLREQITSTLELINARLYVVATGCMTEMIGDDVFGVVNQFIAEDQPILAVNTPSFKGDAYAGYEIVLDGMLNKFLPTSDEKDIGLVNIFGIVPAYDPFFRGDLEEISRLLTNLGIRVNTFFTPDQTFENITSAPKASLNIVFSHVWGHTLAEKFEEKHGVPYWSVNLPIGAEATEQFLLELCERLKIPGYVSRSVIDEENKKYYGYLERTADVFCDSDFKYYAVTATNSNYAIPIVSYLQKELGWLPLEAFVTDLIDDDKKRALTDAYAETRLEAPLIFETDTSQIAKTISRMHPENRGQRYFYDFAPLYILGSTLEKITATRRGASHLSVSYPLYNRVIVDRGYAGYRGGLHLFEDLVSVLVSAK
jgi:nitrogenase molybdenum-iron protein beta chain